MRNAEPWHWPLLGHLEILEDPQSRLNITDVSGGAAANSFAVATADKLHPTSTYWFRAQVISTDEVPTVYAVFVPADWFEMYRVRDGRATMLGVNGYAVPVPQRATRSLWFPLVGATLAPHEPTWLYIRKSPAQLMESAVLSDRIEIASYLRSAEGRAANWHLLGLFYGAVVGVAATNFFRYLLTRNVQQGLCALFVATIALFLYCFDGFATYFLWPTTPRLYSTLDLVGALSLATATLFASKFTAARRTSPLLVRVAWINIGILLGISLLQLCLFILNGYVETAHNLFDHFGVVHYFVGVLIGVTWLVRAAKKGQRGAAVVLGGISVLCVNVVFYVLADLGVSVIGPYIRNGWYLGIFVLIGSVSFGVAADARWMAREAREAQERELHTQQTMIDSQKRLLLAFARFVPGDFLRCLGKSDITEVQLGDAVEARMTILFSDIRSFSSLTEAMSPAQSFAFLNQYLGEIGPIIRKHSGFIDKYIGDAVMALFPGRPADAVAASIDMVRVARTFQHQVNGVRTSWAGIGVGVHAGPLILGTIGEAERMDPTVISDAVNTAARLESLTRVLGANVLCTGPIADALRGIDESERRFLGAFELKGKRELITVVEILAADPDDMRQLKQQTRGDFENAVKVFQRGDHAGARELFQQVLAANPSDGAAQYYLERCGSLA